MRTSEQIKGKVKHFAKINHLRAQEGLQARDKMLADIKEDPYLRGYWENYRRDNPYVGTIDFDDTLNVLQELIEKVFG